MPKAPPSSKPDFAPIDFDIRKDPESDPAGVQRITDDMEFSTFDELLTNPTGSTWTTKEGSTSLLTEMTDAHLVNAYVYAKRLLGENTVRLLRAEARRRVYEREGKPPPWETPGIQEFFVQERAKKILEAERAYRLDNRRRAARLQTKMARMSGVEVIPLPTPTPPTPIDEHAARFAQLDFGDDGKKPQKT